MTDILGPGGAAPNAVTTRPATYRTFGNLDTWFKDCSTPASQDGTAFQADFFNGVLGQFRTTIRGNGQLASGTGPVVTETGNVDAMLLSAIQLLIARGQPNVAADTGTADALAVAPATPWPEYVKGARLWVTKSATAGGNATAAPSIAVSNLAAITILRRDGSALLPGDLPAGAVFCLIYDGVYFRLVSLAWSDVAAGVQSGRWVYGVDKGAVNAAVITLFPVQAPVDGQEILVKLAYANTATAPTINVSGFGTKPIVRQGGGAPAVGDLQPGYLPLVWDAINGFWRVNGFVASDILALIATNQIGLQNPLPAVTTPGTYTYTPSSPKVRAILVRLQGAGGGGGGSSNCTSSQMAVGVPGGGGGYCELYLTSGFSGLSFALGAGGAGGSSAGGVGGAGGTGGAATFGGIASATGGQGGGASGVVSTPAYSNTAAVSGGSANGGNIVNIPGGASQASVYLGSTAYGGLAGPSQLGKSAVPYATTSQGTVGVGYGSGGTPGVTLPGGAGQNGGAGAPALIQITEIF